MSIKLSKTMEQVISEIIIEIIMEAMPRSQHQNITSPNILCSEPVYNSVNKRWREQRHSIVSALIN